ncbi:MAG: hypothetical protein VX044_09260 [Planctomycetota bacterium]|nr:hypothetical protein [Planctomycetota bacterium]
MNNTTSLVALSLLLSLLAACGGEAGPLLKSDAAGAAFALAADPGEARSVADVKAAGPGPEVVVAQGRVQDLTKGFAILKLMGTALHYCGEVNAKGCPTPWDYCCDTPEDRRAHELLVEFRGPDGAPVETVGLPDMRLLDLIKVRGKLTKNEFGSLVFDADGFWKISRPELPSGLNWPE